MSGRCTRAFPRMAPLYALCLAVPLAGGCTSAGIGLGIDTEASPPKASESRQPDTAGMRLADAAERAEAALTALAMMRAAEMPPRPAGMPAEAPGHSPVPGSSPVPEHSSVPPELRRAVTIDWIGPLETLAEALARRAEYRFVMAGAPSVRPVMVSVTAQDEPLIEVLRDAGLQAGNAATIVVDANGRTVRLDWTGDHPGPGERPGPGDHPGRGERPDPDERPGTAPGQEGT